MFDKITYGAAIALSCLLFTLPIQAQEGAPADQAAGEPSPPRAQPTAADIPDLERQSQEAYEQDNYVLFYVANMKLAKLRPYEPRYLANIVRACALLDRKNTAYHYMLKIQQQGLAYDFDQFEDTQNIRGTEAYDHINKLMIEAGKPAGESEIAFRLEHPAADVHAMSWDDTRNRMLVGTLREGSVLAVGEDGSSEVLLKADEENGLWSITGLKVDSANGRLWVVSAAIPVFTAFQPIDAHRGALFEFDLKTLELLNRFNLPIDGLPHELGGIAMTENGHIYVIDRATPIIFHKEPAGKRLEPFVASTELVALRDIAAAPDNSRLFVSDATMGIFVVAPAAEQSMMLTGPENLNLGGIEGIEFRDGELMIVQSDLQPQRIMRLDLDARGATVEEVSPMAIAMDEFDGPGFSTLANGYLYYFANSWSADDEARALILRTPVDAGSEIVPPDIRQFQERIKSRPQ